MLNNDWILNFRNDDLTWFFKYFPYLASDYFYITIIALGYWLRPFSLIFKGLGFLVPFSTLFNCLCKNFFQINRPDFALHLVKVQDSFGFPSGDVQVATVFWGYIFINRGLSAFKYIYLIPIIGIGISRIYLGVHSIYDVIGGIGIGLLTLYIWQKLLHRIILKDSKNFIHKDYWFFLMSTIFLYSIISKESQWSYLATLSIGTLIGFGISLQWTTDSKVFIPMDICNAILFLIGIGFLFILFPTIKTNMLILHLSVMLKFLLMSLGIFYFIPEFYAKFKNKT